MKKILLINLLMVIIGTIHTNKEATVSLSDFLKHPTTNGLSQQETIIKNQIKIILFICPSFVSGGPENLCQMFYELERQGFEVYFLWTYADGALVKKQYKNGQWYVLGTKLDCTPSVYKIKYNVRHLDHDLILNESTLIIVPEVLCDFLPFFGNAKKMIAWLSLTNLHGAKRSEICRPLIEQKKLGDLDCIHASQAPWIEKQLLLWGARPCLVHDYVSMVYFSTSKKIKVENSIAYFPLKGKVLAQTFISLNPAHNYIRLENLDEQGMVQTLDTCKIYIDFGNFPGKDRTPREALLRGCVIFIHNMGCATDFDSFPVDDYFRFSQEDVANGVLEYKVQEVLHNYEAMRARQSFIREEVCREPEVFRNNIKNVFGCPKND